MSWFGSLAPCLAKTSDAGQQGGSGVDPRFFIPVPTPHPGTRAREGSLSARATAHRPGWRIRCAGAQRP